jgi:hypothetical protein
MRKGFLRLIFFVIILVLLYGESRTFYRVDDKYITIWKKIGGECCIVPGRYYGLISPSDNFITTSNENDGVTFYWSKEFSNAIIFKSDKHYTIVNSDTNKLVILDFNKDAEKYYSILYKTDAIYHRDIKDNPNYIDIDIFDNYSSSRK